LKVAVITPYHEINTELQQCIDSVQQQDHGDVLHILVADGCESVNSSSYDNVMVIPLPKNIADYGDTPRSVGTIFAASLNVDAVCYLDSDNWYEADHISSLVELAQTSQQPLLTSLRNLCHINGKKMSVCPVSDGMKFSDTNCLFVTRSLFRQVASWWDMPENMHAIGDRIIWDRLLHSAKGLACTNRATINYRTRFAFHYLQCGEDVPEGCKSGQDIAQYQDQMSELKNRAKKRFQSFQRQPQTL